MTHSVAFVLTLATSITLIVSSFTIVQQTLAQQVSMDITKPSGDKPFGGEKIGTVGIIPNGKVWEGWLVDDGGSGYKLSLGELANNGTLHLTEEMVNPYTYSQFIVTQGPFEDPDPNAAAASGGTQLQTP